MTCIIAYKTKDKIYMGGDSCGYGGDSDVRIFKNPKVFKVGNILCGYAWTYRFGQVFKQCLREQELHILSDPTIREAHRPDAVIQDALIEIFIPALIQKMDEQKILEMKDGIAEGGGFFLGIQGRLFFILTDFSIVEPSGDFITLGSGYQYAMGALAAIQGAPGWEPKDKIRHALEITERYCPSVRGPFTIIEQETNHASKNQS